MAKSATATFEDHDSPANQAIFLPDGQVASCSGDTAIKIWDAASGTNQFALNGHKNSVKSIVLLPNGWLASCSGDTTVIIWDLKARNSIRTLTGHKRIVISLKVLNNGHLASYSTDDTIKIWNPYLEENNLERTIAGHDNPKLVMSLAKSSNSYLVTCTLNETNSAECIMRILDPNNGQLVKSVPTGLRCFGHVLALANDQIAIGFEDGVIKLVDWIDKAGPSAEWKAHDCRVTALEQLSNEHLLSAGSNRSKPSIKMWDLNSLTLLQTVETNQGSIRSLALSPDGYLVASASRDKTINVWSISPKTFC